jgi:hypothetical protein
MGVIHIEPCSTCCPPISTCYSCTSSLRKRHVIVTIGGVVTLSDPNCSALASAINGSWETTFSSGDTGMANCVAVNVVPHGCPYNVIAVPIGSFSASPCNFGACTLSITIGIDFFTGHVIGVVNYNKTTGPAHWTGGKFWKTGTGALDCTSAGSYTHTIPFYCQEANGYLGLSRYIDYSGVTLSIAAA